MSEALISEELTCDACGELAEGASFYKIIKSFTTALEGRATPVIWRPPLVCRVIVKPLSPELAGEWGYTHHAMLEHPEERGAYVPLCLRRERIEPRST